jgi:hypothetical protein
MAYGNEDSEYDREEREYFAVPDMEVELAPFKGNPLPSQMQLQSPVPSQMHLKGTLQHSTRFGGLGEFTPEAVCAIRALDKLVWRFFSQVNDGSTLDALTSLNLFRSLYNHKRATIAPGFSTAEQGVLPQVLNENAWTQDMIRAVVMSLLGGLGRSDARIPTKLGQIPTSMAQLPSWWTGLRDMLTPADLQALRGYIEVPLPTGVDPTTIIARYVQEDLQACAAGSSPTASAPAPSAPAPSAPAPAPVRFDPATGRMVTLPPVLLTIPGGSGGGAPPPRNTSPSETTSSGGARASSGIGLLGFALIAIAAYGAYLAYEDGKKTPAQLRGEEDEDDPTLAGGDDLEAVEVE